MQVMRHVSSFHLINFETELFIHLHASSREAHLLYEYFNAKWACMTLLYNMICPHMLDWHAELHLHSVEV